MNYFKTIAPDKYVHFHKRYICIFLAEYQYDPSNFKVTQEMKDVFDWDGAFVVR